MIFPNTGHQLLVTQEQQSAECYWLNKQGRLELFRYLDKEKLSPIDLASAGLNCIFDQLYKDIERLGKRYRSVLKLLPIPSILKDHAIK